MPPGIAGFLGLLHILIAYGNNLVATIEHRSRQRSFGTIAKGFGTISLPVIRARLARGILRALALQHLLRERARRGCDLVVSEYRERKPRDPAGEDQAGQDQAGKPQRKPRTRVDLYAPPDPAATLTLAQMIAQIRRHAAGRVLADICQDLGIIPSLCDGNFLVPLTRAIEDYRGSMRRWFREYRRREVAYFREQDLNCALDVPQEKRAAIRDILGGFFIGQPIPEPFVLPGFVPAVATGPP